MNRKFGLGLTFLLVAALLLSACGGGGQATQAPAATAAPAATEVMTEAPAATEAMTEAPTATEVMTEAAATEAVTQAATTAATEGAAATGEIDCKGAQQGDEVTMFYQWSGTEEEQLTNILKPLTDKCGIVLKPEASRDQALVDTRVKAGNPYDIIFFNVVQISQYADQLKPVTDMGVKEDNYPEFWRNLGSVDGKWLGLPVKADVKSIIWYSPANFEALGYEVPKTWDELEDGRRWQCALVDGSRERPGHRLDRLGLHPGYPARPARSGLRPEPHQWDDAV
jgi:ABC-type glycerol-3-phosphate transport system substrate-binding protein